MKGKIIAILLSCVSASAFAQVSNSQLQQGYDEFKLAMLQEYEEFRMQCNLEYAEFMKSAWREYGAKPPVPAPKEEKQIIVRDFFAEEGKATASQAIAVKEVKAAEEEKQPMPISKISEIEPAYVAPVSAKIDNVIGTAAFKSLLPDFEIKKENGIVRFFRKAKSAILSLGKGKKDDKASAKNKKDNKKEELAANNQKAEESVPEEALEEVEPEYVNVNFTYFGTKMKVRVIDGFKFQLPDCSEQTLSDAWKLLSTPRFNNTIRDCLELRYDHNMCDWAYIELIYEMAQEYFGKDTNEATFFTAYIYCQSGYKMRLGKLNNKLYLLFASKHFIYDRLYYPLDGNDYFILGNDNINRLEICNTKFAKESNLSLMVPTGVKLDQRDTDVRRIKSTKYTDFFVDVKVNQNILDFYEQYPTSMIDDDFMTRWAMYANTPLDNSVKEQIYPTIKQYLAGADEQTAINKLLSLLQTGLKYEYDENMWGHDRAFFAEETLHYVGCDCEDKSILFSRLVRDILGKKVLLVYFPGHLLTAVHFDSDKVKGLYCMHNGEKYIFCDPTYRGAPLGQIYPEYVKETPSVILLNNK